MPHDLFSNFQVYAHNSEPVQEGIFSYYKLSNLVQGDRDVPFKSSMLTSNDASNTHYRYFKKSEKKISIFLNIDFRFSKHRCFSKPFIEMQKKVFGLSIET